MSEKKPFAEVVAVPTGYGFDEYEIHIGGKTMQHNPRWPNRSLPDEIVPAINIAVDAREREIRAEMAGPFRVWCDQFFAAGGKVTPEQYELLLACGLRVPRGKVDLSAVSEAEMSAELRRRGGAATPSGELARQINEAHSRVVDLAFRDARARGTPNADMQLTRLDQPGALLCDELSISGHRYALRFTTRLDNGRVTTTQETVDLWGPAMQARAEM